MMFSDLFSGVLGLIGGVLTVVMQFPQVSFTHTRKVKAPMSAGDVGVTSLTAGMDTPPKGQWIKEIACSTTYLIFPVTGE